jgi:O-antigen/teichoic acid export membrane protein
MTTDEPRDRRLAGDALWNYGALGVTALAGAAVMFLIAGLEGAAVLGVFAQLYAVHVIAAQVAVFGIHDSTQRHVAQQDAAGGDAAIVVGALGVVAVIATVLAAGLALAAVPAGRLVQSPDVGRGLYLVAPGIVCFALNKVLFAALNGRGALRTYARMQLVRAALVLAAAVAVVVTPGVPSFAVGGIFAAAELLLLPAMIAVVRPGWRRARRTGALPDWRRRHLAFGGLGLVNSILLETHLRVDVLTLGYFVVDRAIGVYAFAVLFAEGIYQVPVVMRTVAYPTLVRLATRADRGALAATARKLSLTSGAACAGVSLVVAAVYPLVAGRIDPAFATIGSPVLWVLLAGMCVHAFVVPFDQLLLQSGYPGRQSALMAVYVGGNVALNLLLIPRFGLMGAAVATAIALCGGAVLLLLASWGWLGYRGTVLFHRAPAA